MIKIMILLTLGFCSGLWIPWPGIVKGQNWNCAKDIVIRSMDDQIDIRTFMTINIKDILGEEKNGFLDRLRLVGYTCFR
tara:strand:- start:1398 stop:1634 length:237 start_codon:yes stop_codon:yes gene_type:complete